MSTVLVTGSNRGLGLEFVKQYAQDGWTVLAACRSPKEAEALNALASGHKDLVSVHQLDVGDIASMEAFSAEIGGRPVDLLINNAGVFGSGAQEFGSLDPEAYEATLRVNSVSPLILTQILMKNIDAGKKKCVAFVTSQMGSIADNTSGGHYAYRASKAALNAAVRSLSVDLKASGIRCALLHPGWVVTDMGGASAPTQPPESIEGMRKVIEELTMEQSGEFFNFKGEVLPW